MSGVVDGFTLTIPGKPVPCPRPRVVTANGRSRTFLPDAYVDWRTGVSWAFTKAIRRLRAEGYEIEAPWTTPVALAVRFINPRKSADIDNLVKGIMDAASRVVYHDDRQIVRLVAEIVDEGIDKATLRRAAGRTEVVFESLPMAPPKRERAERVLSIAR